MPGIRKEIGSQYGEADGYFVTGQIIGKNLANRVSVWYSGVVLSFKKSHFQACSPN